MTFFNTVKKPLKLPTEMYFDVKYLLIFNANLPPKDDVREEQKSRPP